jgi:N-acetyl-anhydromuramyl-L-alanine amidase AmpD
MPNLLWMPNALLRGGCKVAPRDGWETRGRATFGEFKGVMIHHTASTQRDKNAPSLKVVTDGRSDLSGPLCNLLQARDGAFYAVAAGRANHAGAGSWHGVTNGNSNTIGIECENDGVGEPWPEAQVQFLAMGVAALLDYGKLPTVMCMGHKEYCTPKGRKIDPSFDMNAFRLRVDAIRNGGIVRPLIPAKDAQSRPTLRRGAKGHDVRVLQVYLNLDADGTFGPATEAALRAYQRAHGLVPDGICGPACWALIDAVKVAA